MKYISLFLLAAAVGCVSKPAHEANDEIAQEDTTSVIYPEEHHFANMKQLTFGGDNAEAYWSFNGDKVVFQSNYSAWEVLCDQIFVIDANTPAIEKPQMVSTGSGRTTCAYFMPGDTTVIFASTHLGNADCPVEPERDAGRYVWPIYNTYDIFVSDLEGNVVRQLTNEPGYDAEATLSPQGDKIVFTSDRSGDLELYTMNTDGSDVQQVTNELGYDGGAFFGPEGTGLILRGSRPQTE